MYFKFHKPKLTTVITSDTFNSDVDLAVLFQYSPRTKILTTFTTLEPKRISGLLKLLLNGIDTSLLSVTLFVPSANQGNVFTPVCASSVHGGGQS